MIVSFQKLSPHFLMNLRPFNHGSKAMHVKPIEKDKIQE